MIINSFVIFDLCRNLWIREHGEVDWGMIFIYFLCGIYELFFFDAPIYLFIRGAI